MKKVSLFQSLGRRLFSGSAPRRSSAERRSPLSAQVERLEHRELLSASPLVTSVDRVGPVDTNATSVDYTVTFSEDVQGVNATDFTVMTSGGVVADATVAVTPVSGSVYTVSVSGVNGSGIVGLDLADDNSIHDADGNTLIGAGITSQLSNLSSGQYVEDWRVSEDGSTIVYSVGEGNYAVEFWSASTDQGPAVQLDAPLTSTESIESWNLSPDGKHVIFSVRDNVLEHATSVWITPTTGGAASELLDSLGPSESIDWRFNSTSDSVVLRIYDSDVGRHTSIWSASTSGGPATLLYAAAEGENIDPGIYSEDGTRIVFTVQDRSLWAAPSTGAAATQLYELTSFPERSVYWEFAGANVVFVISDFWVPTELWLAPAGGTATQLNAPLEASQRISWVLSDDRSTLVYSIQDDTTGGALSLWLVSTSGGVPEELYACSAEQTLYWQFSRDNTHVLYTVYDNDQGKYIELWGAPLSGGDATMLNPPLSPTQSITNRDFSSPQVIFVITDSETGCSVWVTPTTGSPAIQMSFALATTDRITGWQFSEDGSKILVGTYDVSDSSRTTSLWVSPITGGAAAQVTVALASDESMNNWRFSPDGSQVLFTVNSSLTGTANSLWSAPSAGGSSVQLSAAFGPGESLYDWIVAPNGTTVFYFVYDSSVGKVTSMWSVPIDASEPASQLSPTLGPSEYLDWSWSFSGNGAWLIFSVYDSDLYRISSIWAAPADGGAAVNLTPTLGPDEALWGWNSSSDRNSLILEVRNTANDTTAALWLASAVTGTLTQMTPPLSSTESIGSYEFDSEGAHVAFTIVDTTVWQTVSLWMAPTNGDPAVQISPTLDAGQGIAKWSFSPDGNNFAFSLSSPQGQESQLWVLPLSEGASATLIKSASQSQALTWSWAEIESDKPKFQNNTAIDSVLVFQVRDTRTWDIIEIGEYSSSNGSVTGPTYTIDQATPTVTILPASSSPITGTSATFTVTFSEDVVGVTANDFALALGGVSVSAPMVVTPVNGHVYTVSLSGISGNGTIGVNLVNADQSVEDPAGNVVVATTGGLLTVNQPGGPVQLSGSTLTVNGDGLNNVISITEGNTLTVVVDGISYLYTPNQVTAIVVNGNDGIDTIQVNSLLAGTTLTADGGNGNDTLRVAAAVTGAVSLSGGNGNDTLVGGSGNDTLDGGVGNDWLNGGEGSDLLTGGTGNDVYAFDNATGNQIDTVVEQTGEGTDLLNFATLTTAVTVNLTSDTALATMARRAVVAGALDQAAFFENVNGGSGNDSITGNDVNNVVYANGGNDTVRGLAGNDQLYGGDGNDVLQGGAGNDALNAGIGNDWLNGGNGSNILTGGQGNDVYAFDDNTVGQVDTVVELVNEGTDLLNFSALTQAVTVDLNSDTLLASTPYRIVQTGAVGRAANFENVNGGSANDFITGNAANNVIYANGGNDTVNSKGGDDEIYGGADNDLLRGDVGNDVIDGGVGNDWIDGGDGTDVVKGGTGDNILLGGNGNDSVQADSGRNILVGGIGADTLQGGTGEDVLLSGDLPNPSTLNAMLAAWTQGIAYTTRVNTLLASYLTSSTVVNDSDIDTLTGASGQDFFLADSSRDVLTAQDIDEVFTRIDTWGV